MKKHLSFLSLLLGLCYAQIVTAQSTKFSGHIYDNDSQKPVSGVSVSIKGKNTGTITNSEGFFI